MAKAYAALEHIKETYHIDYLRGIADVAATSGDMHRAEGAMNDLREYAQHNYVSPLVFASYEMQFGDREKAFKWLEKGYRERASGMIDLDVHGSGAFASDPRFHELVRRVGFR